MSATDQDLSHHPDTVHLEAKFGVFLDAVAEAILLVSSEGSIVLINEAAERLFGYAKGELLGKPAETLLPQRFSSARAELPASLFTQTDGPAVAVSDLFGLRKDNSEFPAEIIRQPVHTEDGAYALITVRDLTERKHLRQQLKEQTAALEAAREEFHSFSHSISHDLRAPLRAMDGFAGMLKRALGEGLSKDSEHALSRIQENASKMSKLIEGLLDFSTLSWVALTRKTIHPETIAQKSFEGLSFSLNERRIDFSIGELPPCLADAALLRRLFDNILSNALKYTRKKDAASIRVGCRTENGEPVYFVQDNGVGFDMEYAAKLFHVFQRLHSPSEFEGTGMGLAIAERIVQRHGGRIWATSQIDHGATFYFTLGKSGYGHSA